jgi:hypothetical protein
MVGGIPASLKNDGVRQLGSLVKPYMEKKSHVPNHQPAKVEDDWYHSARSFKFFTCNFISFNGQWRTMVL